MTGFPLLLLAALIWLGLHLGVSGTALRGRLVARLGERGFLAGFSILSVAALVLMVVGYNGSGTTILWVAPEWLRGLLALVMLAAFLLFAGAIGITTPTAVGGQMAEPRGMQRVTRHPMLWSFALWGAVHVLGNGTSAALLFFGTFLLTALAGMPSIDAKVARRDPAGWAGFARATSILPFAAIAQGRNRFAAGEFGWVRAGGALAVWAVLLLGGHAWLFGVRPVG
jgi:uncharacterized membrane protein